MRSSTETLIAALQILARDIQSEDGIANAAIEETADRLTELERENAALRAWKESALAVERELNAQTTAKLLGARLGESCHKVIAEKVPQLVAENAKLREVLNRLGYDETGRVLFQK